MTRDDDLGDLQNLTPTDGLGDVHATALVRVHDTVHVRGCWHTSHVKRTTAVLPWDWAEDKSLWEVATARENGLRFCYDCRPLNRTCGAPGPMGACDRPHGHGAHVHAWGYQDGPFALWNDEERTEPADVDL